MPNDAITLNALVQELHASLSGKRIAKIYQTKEYELDMLLRSGERLTLSVNPSLPCVYLTSKKREAKLNAPPFQMLLRKHIGSAKIENLSLFNKDRIIKIAISTYSELRDTKEFYLYIELMGRYSNIIFTDESNKIIDAIKRISFGDSNARILMPNVYYNALEQNKVAPDDIARLKAVVDELVAKGELSEKGIIANISGISKETAREVLQRAESSGDIANLIVQFFNMYNTAEYAPCASVNQNGQALDAFICPYKSVDKKQVPQDSLISAYEKVYLQRATLMSREQNARELTRVLKKLKDKNQKRKQVAENRLAECEGMQEFRKFGELLIANIYKLKGGESSISVYDYYDEQDIDIPLDTNLSPSKNADRYFKRYHKLKRAKQIYQDMLAECFEQDKYFDSIATAINVCSSEQEFAEIRAELVEIAKPQRRKKEKYQKTTLNKITFQGYDIYYGKNNKQNDAITFGIASPSDIWLHVKDYPGAHVVIKGENIPESVLREGARLAGELSSIAGKCEVVWCKRKYVKRHPSGACGQAIYKNHKTILID